MLFSSIAALVRQGVKITFSVEAIGEDKIEVTVTPTAANAAENKSGVSLVPKAFKATPAEFDAEFDTILQEFCSHTLSLHEQVQAANQVIAAAAKQASEAALKPARTPAKAATPAKPGAKPAKPEPELLSEGGDNDEADDHGAGESDATRAGSEVPAPAPAAGGSLELNL